MVGSSAPRRILLVDDHPLIADGVRAQLAAEEGLEVVGQASSGTEALEAMERLSPDLTVLDLNLPDMGGLEIARRGQADFPHHIVVLTMHDEEEYVVHAVSAGVRGYVLKDAHPAELVRAIRTVAGGGVYYCSAISKYFVKRFRTSSAERIPRLTMRERQVLVQVADGLTNLAIAAELDLSLHTIQTYRERIMKKLDLHSVADLTRYAIREGLVTATAISP